MVLPGPVSVPTEQPHRFPPETSAATAPSEAAAAVQFPRLRPAPLRQVDPDSTVRCQRILPPFTYIDGQPPSKPTKTAPLEKPDATPLSKTTKVFRKPDATPLSKTTKVFRKRLPSSNPRAVARAYAT